MTRSHRMQGLLLLGLLLLGGTLVPPSLYAQDYLLFASTASDTRGLVYTMDGAGNLKLRETIPVSYDAPDVEVSPDGRTVAFSSYTSPTLTVVSIKPDGALRPPVYLTNPDNVNATGYDNVCFHPSFPYFYVGSLGVDIVRYDSDRGTAELIGQIPFSEHAGLLGYSSVADSLITSRHKYDDPISRLGAVRLSADGQAGQEEPFLSFPWLFPTQIGTVSSNGRWAVIAGYGGGSLGHNNELALVRVGGDGTLSLADQIEFQNGQAAGMDAYTRFSPDGRRLYLLSADAEQTLLSYTLDEDQGRLTQRGAITYDQMPQAYGIPLGLTISPDGRFAAFRSVNDQQVGHNWINVVRLFEDGSMQYLQDKRVDVPQYLGDLVFTGLPHNAAGPAWALYE